MSEKKFDSLASLSELIKDKSQIAETESPSFQKQNLEIYLTKKNRGGKTATIIRGFILGYKDLNNLFKEVKKQCSTGGSIKNGEMLIQGDFIEKICVYFENKGHNIKRVNS